MDNETGDTIEQFLMNLREGTGSVFAALILVEQGQMHVFACIEPGFIMTPEGVAGIGEAVTDAARGVSDQNAEQLAKANKGAVS